MSGSARSPRARAAGASSAEPAGRTGARRAPKPVTPATADAATARMAVTHRGVRWERNTYGRLRWHDDDADRWVLWKSGQDAPPRPPEWVSEGGEALGTPLRDKRARAGWRSPYRLVPIGLVVLVLIIGVVQATRDKAPSAASLEKASTAKLLGRCLVADGTADGQPRYEAGSLSCTSAQASVKVIKVLPGTPGSPACPADTTTVRIAYPGVTFPHRECVQPVVH